MKSPKTLTDQLCAVENHFRAGLRAGKTQITHFGVQGADAENRWIDLLRYYLPKRYEVNRAFVVDSKGAVSEQIDCVVYDAFYTPSLYGIDDGRYVPAEAVYAVFESKPGVNKQTIQYADNKIESVRKLHRTSGHLVDVGKRRKSRKPFKIIGGLLAVNIKMSPETALQHFKNTDLDIVLCAGDKDDNSFCTDKFDKSRTPRKIHQKGALMRGMFRLLEKLQSTGTVAAIEWSKYEKSV